MQAKLGRLDPCERGERTHPRRIDPVVIPAVKQAQREVSWRSDTTLYRRRGRSRVQLEHVKKQREYGIQHMLQHLYRDSHEPVLITTK